MKEARPWTLMCSYNKINGGVLPVKSPRTLTEILRDEWGFDGYVMSDWGAVNDRVKGLAAGLELEMPSSNGVRDAQIVAAVRGGTLEEAVLDQGGGAHPEHRVPAYAGCTGIRRREFAPARHTMRWRAELETESAVLLQQRRARSCRLHGAAKIAVFIGRLRAKSPGIRAAAASHINVSTGRDARWKRHPCAR